jgi:aspartate/methionine/tyrosine aminotransferase
MVPHRKGLAQKLSLPDCSLTENDIIFFTGEDMAINHIMRVFCNPGDNFIIPNPTLGYWVDSASGFGFECRQYKLLPEQDWQADLKDLRSKIDDKTKFILIMNPSYPTGGVHSEEHLREIIKIAEENTIPIVANEIYSEYLFKDSVASSIPKISGDVPVV